MSEVVDRLHEMSFGVTANLHKWHAFVAVTELGNLTRAASLLDLDQSVLSRRINSLERDCNARLFVRNGRGVALSEAGARILPHARQLLRHVIELEQAVGRDPVRPATPRSEEIGLALPLALSVLLLQPLVQHVRRYHPGIRLKVMDETSESAAAVPGQAQPALSVAYRWGGAHAGDRVLARMQPYVVGPRGDALTRQASIPLRALHRRPLALPGVRSGMRLALDRLLRRDGVEVQLPVEAEAAVTLKRLVERHGLHTILPLHVVMAEIRDGRLQAARLDVAEMPCLISLACPDAIASKPAAIHVGNALAGIVEDLAGQGMWQWESAGKP